MNTNYDQEEAKDIEVWRNEHGEPEFACLEALRREGSIEALEKLQAIATDMDVDFNATTSMNDLIGEIVMAAQKNEDGNPTITS